jgi:hypothetical protein
MIVAGTHPSIQIDLGKDEPGDTITFDEAQDFIKSVSACGDIGGIPGPNLCFADFIESEQQIYVNTEIYAVPADRTATGKALNYFSLISSSGSQSSDSISGLVSGQVDWFGNMKVAGAFFGDADASIKILARVWVTDTDSVIAEQVLLDTKCAANWGGGCTRSYAPTTIRAMDTSQDIQ